MSGHGTNGGPPENGGPPGPSESPSLDEAFPLGDGTAQDVADMVCPYCAEWVTVSLDPGSGPRQDYVEDCPVCCRPWQVTVRYGADGAARVELRAEDEG